MDLVLLIGIPASGKSTFYKEHFFHTHVRVNLDMLRTRNREKRLLDFCFQTRQPVVVDNTNVTVADRQKYISLGKQHQFRVRGYYFQSYVKESIARNALRTGREHVPEKGIYAKSSQLELPSFAEGFDELFYARLQDNGFLIQPWQEENPL
jgi:predicted kinase